MNARSIRFRLIAWYAGLLTGVFLLLGALLYFDLKFFLESDLRNTQARRARQIADSLLARVPQMGEGYAATETKDLYEPEVNDRFIRITRMDGRVVYKSGTPNDQSFDPSQLPPLTPSPRSEFSQKVRLSESATLLIAGLKYQATNGVQYLVEVGAPLDPVETMLNHLFLQLAIGLPIAVLVAIAGGYLLVGRALAPVDQIGRKAELITQHNLGERLPVPRTADELERLSLSLNHMIGRLDDAFLNSKRFVADASHELRTPLTVIRAELESMASNRSLAPEFRETIGSVLEEVERLARIVEQLFALSRLDAGEAQAEWVRFDLAELAATTAEQMSLLAEDKGISLACDSARPVLVDGDRSRIKQVVVNLLDNAIKYTSEKGRIELRVVATNGHAVLEVSDNGIGIPVDAQSHVFERFFRVDTARVHDVGGAGLGLSIVKSICTAHGATAEVLSNQKGSLFRVTLSLSNGKTLP